MVRKKLIGVQTLYQVGTVSMVLYTRTIIQTKTTPSTMVTMSHNARNPDGSFFRAASSHPSPPTAKKIAPLAISLLSEDAPTRLRELNARIGEPRCSVEAIKPIPINTHRPNILSTTRCCCSAFKSPFSNASASTIQPPATHCPKAVKIISGHSCHPLPISHLLRVCQIAGGISRRAAVGVRFNHNARLGEVRGRQWRDGRKLTVFFTQLVNRAEGQSAQRTGLHANRLFALCDAVVAAVALGHVAFGGVVLRRTVRAGHMAVAAADADILIHHHKPVVTLVHCPARAHFGAGRVFTMVTGNRQVIGKDVLMPDAVILLPVAARVFVDPAEADVRGQVFVILAGQLAGFAPGATAGINKKSILGCHRLLLTPSQPEQGLCGTGC